MTIWNNDNEMRDANGHLPDTPGRNIAAICAVVVGIAAFFAFVYIVLFV